MREHPFTAARDAEMRRYFEAWLRAYEAALVRDARGDLALFVDPDLVMDEGL